MKLHSPAFEKTLRRRIRREVRASARLKREARAGRMRSHVRASAEISRTLSTAVFLAATLAAGARTGHFESGLAIIALCISRGNSTAARWAFYICAVGWFVGCSLAVILDRNPLDV